MDHRLRLYDNPFKQSFYLLISLGFIIAGMLLLRNPKFSAGAPNVMTHFSHDRLTFFGE